MISTIIPTGPVRDNVDAVSRIFEEYEDFIREIIQRWNPVDADDLFQDFFLFLTSKPIPDYVENIKGYLYRALTNDIHDFFRHSSSYRSRLKRYAFMLQYLDSIRTQDQIFDDNDTAARIFKLAEEKLPPYLARTFHLHFKEQCTIREISVRIGIPPRAVSVYLSKAIKQVREHVEQGDREEENRRKCV
jgi:RNA polymerase sigma factor (sigma-70 family)